MAEFPVFISWSKAASKEMAESLRLFLELVLAKTSPWVSSVDIDSGARWPEKLREEIEQTAFCVVCVTSDNIERPWLNYEIGAIFEGLRKPTAPWMLDITPEKFAMLPLNPSQGAGTDKEGTRKLILSINKALMEHAHRDEVVNKQFETHWPDLEAKLEGARKLVASPTPEDRPLPKVLDELVINTRAILEKVSKRHKLGASLTEDSSGSVALVNEDVPHNYVLRAEPATFQLVPGNIRMIHSRADQDPGAVGVTGPSAPLAPFVDDEPPPKRRG